MAITANAVNNNIAVRDAASKVYLGFQKLTQNSTRYDAAAIAELQADVTALKAALTTAGA